MHLQKPMLGVPLDWSNQLNKGLVMHLACNEGHGDVVRDLSMNGNHGTLNGFAYPPTVASGWNPGRAGVGLTFDGANDYVDCGNDESLNITENLTIGAWIKTTENNIPIVTKDNWPVAANKRCYDLLLPNGLVQINIFGLTGEWVAGTSDLRDNIWHYVVGTYDGSDIMIYVDGVNEKTEPSTGSINSFPTQTVEIGSRSTNGDYFNGSIDQVRIHNRALTAKEIKDYAMNPWSVYLDEED